MVISIASDITHQPLSTSPKGRQPPVRTATMSADPVLDQFQQMRSMISTFLGARQDSTPSPRQSFCNYLHFEIENLEERDFLTFRNETVNLLSEIQYKAEEHKRQVTKSPEVTTYHLPKASQAHHTGNSTSLHSRCAACTDRRKRICYSDCQSSTTTKAFISVSTANFLRSCG